MLIWISVLALAVVIELATVQLVSVPFMIGSIFAVLSAYAGVDFSGQLIIFTITSIIGFFVFQIAIRKKIMPKKTATNVEALVGKELLVEVFENGRGVGKVHGVEWNIISNDVLTPGMIVVIKNLKGTTLVVGKE